MDGRDQSIAMMPPTLRKKYAEILERQVSHVALTLVYNEIRISLDRIRQDLKGLRNRVDRILLGSRYYKRQAHERSQFWAVVELIRDYPHIHCGWRLPEPHGIDDLNKMLAGRMWLHFAPHGEYNTQKYRYGWAAYSTKDLTDSTSIIQSEDFLR